MFPVHIALIIHSSSFTLFFRTGSANFKPEVTSQTQIHLKTRVLVLWSRVFPRLSVLVCFCLFVQCFFPSGLKDFTSKSGYHRRKTIIVLLMAMTAAAAVTGSTATAAISDYGRKLI